jgi:hypothetical protein
LLADRAIDNQTQDQSQKVIRENEPEIRQNRRKAYQMEREGGAVVQERLKVLPPSEVQGFGSGLLKQAKSTVSWHQSRHEYRCPKAGCCLAH